MIKLWWPALNSGMDSVSRTRHLLPIAWVQPQLSDFPSVTDTATLAHQPAHSPQWKEHCILFNLGVATDLTITANIQMLLPLCSRGLLPSCHGSFPASSCVHSVHETLLPGFHRLHLLFKPLRYRLGSLVFPSRQRSTSRRHCRRGSWHLSVFTVERLAVSPCRHP